jgi:hypothetical protein
MSHNGHRTGCVPESGGRSGLDISHKRDFLQKANKQLQAALKHSRKRGGKSDGED